MKKILVICAVLLVAAAAYLFLMKPGADGARLGLGVTTDLSESKHADGGNGTAKADSTAAALVLDGQNRIVKCQFDAVDAQVNFSGSGQITTNLGAPPQSKRQLGDQYGMKAASRIGKEWYEQADAFAASLVGKPLGDVLALPLTADGHLTEVDAVASCTINVAPFIRAIGKAADLAAPTNAQAGDKLGISLTVDLSGSKSAEGAAVTEPEASPAPAPEATPEVSPAPAPEAAPEVSPAAAPEETPVPSPAAIVAETPSPSPAAEPSVPTAANVDPAGGTDDVGTPDVTPAADATPAPDATPDTPEATPAPAGTGLARFYLHAAAATVNASGAITGAALDAAVVEVEFDANGAIVTDLNAPVRTKNELGSDYGMKAASSIGKEWNEQAAAFAAYAAGKSPDALDAIPLDATGHATAPDVLSTATISVAPFIKALTQAAKQAK